MMGWMFSKVTLPHGSAMLLNLAQVARENELKVD
jgi:hypothetical protein